ncbi:hypothetical protein BDW60DRAFT_186043 [Aspergillus nidulans var. acristatus]
MDTLITKDTMNTMSTMHLYADSLGIHPADHYPTMNEIETTENTYPRYTSPSHPSILHHPRAPETPPPCAQTAHPPSWALASQAGYRMNEPSLSPTPEHRPAAGPPNGPNLDHDCDPRRPARRRQPCGVGTARPLPGCPGQGQEPSRRRTTFTDSNSNPDATIRCWDHGCEGRKFSSVGNYRRHLREKNGQAKMHPCPDCGRVFTRSTARNFHRQSGTCGLIPSQLMLQMGMGMQLQVQMQPVSQHSLASPYPPAFNPAPPVLLDPLADWSEPGQMDLYAASGVVFDR